MSEVVEVEDSSLVLRLGIFFFFFLGGGGGAGGGGRGKGLSQTCLRVYGCFRRYLLIRLFITTFSCFLIGFVCVVCCLKHVA